MVGDGILELLALLVQPLSSRLGSVAGCCTTLRGIVGV
jgi:hypothetical protein